MTDTDASLLARLQERKDYASKDYASDTSLGYYWRQCRWCKGYAEAPVGTEVSSHALDCPVPDLEAAADALRRSGEALRELQMGHVRLDECAGSEATRGRPLYDRISVKIQEMSDRINEAENLLKATAIEKDILAGQAGAAEHRQIAAEYRARRIGVDAAEARAEAAEKEVRRSGEALRRLQEDIKALPRCEVNQLDDMLQRCPKDAEPENGQYVRIVAVLEILSRQSGAEGTEAGGRSHPLAPTTKGIL